MLHQALRARAVYETRRRHSSPYVHRHDGSYLLPGTRLCFDLYLPMQPRERRLGTGDGAWAEMRQYQRLLSFECGIKYRHGLDHICAPSSHDIALTDASKTEDCYWCHV